MPLDTVSLFLFLFSNKIAFQVSFGDESYTYIGIINKLLTKSFYMKMINSRGVWIEKCQLIRMDFIRKIEFETNYINSLLIYNKSI